MLESEVPDKIPISCFCIFSLFVDYSSKMGRWSLPRFREDYFDYARNKESVFQGSVLIGGEGNDPLFIEFA